MTAADTVRVALGARSYDIAVGEDLIATAGERVRAAIGGRRRAVIVTDRTVGDLYLAPLRDSLDAAGLRTDAVIVPPGEGSKDFRHFARLAEDILALGIDRGTILVALGGGVVGDLAGFAAATLLRGIDFVQVPTTLLAQVDSSVGGKTGINTAHGKNLVGAFHQPLLVLADIGALDTLPPREIRAGYAEIAKYGLIRDKAFFDWLDGGAGAVLCAGGDRAVRRQAVVQSCRMKAAIVAADERETGDQRALLNFGHTFGHALEAETGYSDTLLHGEAVAIGMVQACRFSARRGLCTDDEAERVARHVEAVGLPVRPPRPNGAALDPGRLLAHMRKDKKVVDGTLTFVLARGIGEAFVARDVDADDVQAFLGTQA
ncbi:MAG TPA: 3-dehydroquinate synthase [Stellaceae bacterium]